MAGKRQINLSPIRLILRSKGYAVLYGRLIIMIFKKKEDSSVVYLQGEQLSLFDKVLHGFSTRCGGVSKGYLGEMNLSYSRGDIKESVDENFRIIGDAIGFEPESLVFTDQTHTANVRVAAAADKGKGYSRGLDYSDVDGLVTDVKGLVLSVFTADCIPVLFYDPVKECIGTAHSGWRGSADKICKNVVELMISEYGSSPADIRALIGPGICQDCYEVSSDVAEVFQRIFDEDKCSLILKEGRAAGKYQLDLTEVCRLTLLDCGVKEENIELSNICTCHNPSFLFSHRATGGKRGNAGGFISLKP